MDKKTILLNKLKNDLPNELEVVQAFDLVPRHFFVPQAFIGQAWDDIALPIHCGQTISQPSTVAFMTSQLELSGNEKVLEIGTGSGYQAAILSYLSRRVYSIERHKFLLKQAERRFDELRIHNITVLHGNGFLGYNIQAPFSKIIVTAAAKKIPAYLANQLSVGGIMIVPIGEENNKQVLIKLTRNKLGFKAKVIAQTRFVPLLEDNIIGTT